MYGDFYMYMYNYVICKNSVFRESISVSSELCTCIYIIYIICVCA